MSLHNALQYGSRSDHSPETVRRLAGEAGIAITEEELADVSRRAFGEAHRFERCRLDINGSDLWPDPIRGEWWLRCCDEDGGGAVRLRGYS